MARKLSATSLLFGFLLGCQSLPTKVYEQHDADLKPLVESARKPIIIDKKTAIIDARSAFNYSLAHIPRAYNLRWEEMSFGKRPFQGLLADDMFKVARRLARLGVGPESKVVVVGAGPAGRGQEGRVAWTLYYLGISKVQFASENYFKLRLTNTTKEKPRKNVPIWKPKYRSAVLVEFDEIRAALNRHNSPYRGQSELSKGYAIIDVRSSKEYMGRKGIGLRKPIPNMGAINIEWREFLDEKGRPNLAIRRQLEDVGITRNKRVIVISEQGVRSAAVTMALLSMGYSKAGNYAGGLSELLAKYGR